MLKAGGTTALSVSLVPTPNNLLCAVMFILPDLVYCGIVSLSTFSISPDGSKLVYELKGLSFLLTFNFLECLFNRVPLQHVFY